MLIVINEKGENIMKYISLAGAFLLSLSFVISAASALAAEGKDIFTVKVGDFTVSMVSEGQSENDPKILIGAADEDIARFIPTGKYPSAVAAYLIETPDGAALVDTGFGREIANNLKTLGITPADIKTVLITHSHGDHIGGLLKDGDAAFPNAKAVISKRDFEWSSQVREYLGKYEGKVETITPGKLETGGAEILKGVKAIEAYGHTPGHTVFIVESKGEKLLIWGDLTHAMAIQMPRPGVSVTYDSDPEAAAEVRKAILEYTAKNRIPIAGMHIAYPGVGSIEADPGSLGGYIFTPLSDSKLPPK
jgi:glyoxylase-like metal-dependent hydrolase (beta-lactamase superfamily II)